MNTTGAIPSDAFSPRRRGSVILLLAVALAASGCTASSPPSGGGPGASAPPSAVRETGDTATWQFAVPDTVDVETTALTLEVTRLGCSGGVTGDLLTPWIVYEDDRIVIQIDAEPLGDGAYDCQGNDAVPVEVELEEPIGDRELVDGACLEGDATTTAACEGGAVRWPVPGGA